MSAAIRQEQQARPAFDHGPSITVDAEALWKVEDFLVAATREPEDAFQKFMRGYAWSRFHGQSFYRMSFCISQLIGLIPRGGSWLDVGSFGIEGVALQHFRPDVARIEGVSFQGCIIGLDETGAHYRGKKEPGAVRVHPCDVEHETLPFEDGAFDVVSAFEVVEHFKFSPRQFLLEARRVLKPGGLIFVTTPNINGMISIYEMLKGDHPQQEATYSKNPKAGITHPLEYNWKQMKQLLESYGFDIITLSSFEKEDHSDRAEKFKAIEGMIESAGFQVNPEMRHEKLYALARKAGPVTNEYPDKVFRN